MVSRAEATAEAYRRGLLPPSTQAAYEEAVNRGLVSDSYAMGKVRARRSGAGKASAAMATFNEAIPGLDELTAGLDTIGRVASGQPINKAWRNARDEQAGQINAFSEDHPNLANLTTGLSYAAQGGLALASGGASLAPTATGAAEAGLGAAARRIALRTAKNATVGGSYAAANAFASRGDLNERTQKADASIPTGAALGVAIPVAAKALAAAPGVAARVTAPTRRAVTRAANNAASRTPIGPFLDPQQEVVSRLTEALRKDGLEPAQIGQAMSEWNRVGGPSPAFMDLVARNGGGQNTMALFRGAAITGPGRNVASQYGNRVAVDLQDNAVARTRQLTPDGRSAPEVQADVTARIADHSQGPEVTAGRAGAQVSERLNAQYDAGKAGVNAAYDAVGASDAQITAPTLSDLPGRIRGRLEENLITPEVMGSLNPATRGILSEIDRLSGRAGQLDRAAQPNSAASLEAGIPSGGTGEAPSFPLMQIERVRKAINARLPTVQGEDKVALDIAKREFDGWLGHAVENDLITGDAQAVAQLKAARALHAQQRTTFGGDDLLQALTERDRHGAGTANVVSPDDASNAILGRIGVSNRGDMVRDLTRLREHLGANSPEWRGVQQEAQSRILGRDAGTERFGQAWDRFSNDNPELARLLASPDDLAALSTSRQAITGAVADRGALDVGQRIMNTTGDDFAAGVSGVGDRRPLVQVGAARAIQDAIERPAENATGVLNRVSTSTRSKRNLANAFGPAPAADYQQAVGQMVDQVQNARFINPNSGSATAGRLADQQLVEDIPASKVGAIKWLIDKVRQHATLTDQERELLVRLATAQPDAVIPQIPATAPPVNAFAPTTNASVLAAPVGISQAKKR